MNRGLVVFICFMIAFGFSALILIVDWQLLPVPKGGKPFTHDESTHLFDELHAKTIELTTDASALMSTYALGVLGVLGYFLKTRVAPEDPSKARPLDRWEFIFMGLIASLTIIVLYLGLTVPITIAKMLNHNFLTMTDKSVELVVVAQASLLLCVTAFLGAFLLYQAIPKR